MIKTRGNLQVQTLPKLTVSQCKVGFTLYSN